MPFPMKSPGRAAGGDCSVDTGGSGIPYGLCPDAGSGTGYGVWVSAPTAPPAHPAFRRTLFGCCRMGVDLSLFRRLCRGYPGRLRVLPAGRGNPLGNHLWAMASSVLFPVLERNGRFAGCAGSACEKIFRIFEIFVCICEKMGYNRKKPFQTTPTTAQRESP